MTCSTQQVHCAWWVSPDATTAFSWLQVSFEDTGLLDKLFTASKWEESTLWLPASPLSCSLTLLTSFRSVSQSSACLLLFPLLWIEAPLDGEDSLMTKTQWEKRNLWVHSVFLQGSTSVLYLLQVPDWLPTLRLHCGWFILFGNRVYGDPVSRIRITSGIFWSVERFGHFWSIDILAAE